MTGSTDTIQTDALRRLLADHSVPCPKCGYNLRGLRDLRCPECGIEITPEGVFPPAKKQRPQTIGEFAWLGVLATAVGAWPAALFLMVRPEAGWDFIAAPVAAFYVSVVGGGLLAILSVSIAFKRSLLGRVMYIAACVTAMTYVAACLALFVAFAFRLGQGGRGF